MLTGLQRIMIDLHGLSITDAEKTVHYWIAKATQESYYKARFVTGRGNHVNKQGERGTLYKSFLKWVEHSSYKDNIRECKQYDGYFEIIFKTSKPEHVESEQFNAVMDTIISTHTTDIITQAESGNPYFEFLYAVLLEEGKVVTQDYKKSADFSLRAANKNYSPAMFQVGRFYFHGIGVRQSDLLAVEWFEKADREGDVSAALALGECYMLGHGVKPDERKAIAYYAKAAAKGNRDAMRKLGSAYHTAHGIDKSDERAFFWYKKCADLGDAVAQFNVAIDYRKATGTKRDLSLALRYFKMSAENGDADAAFILGKVYIDGHIDDIKVVGFEQNEALGLEWINKSAAKGSVQANQFLRQQSTAQSSDVHVKRAADSGSPFAKFSLALQENGDTLTENDKDVLLDKKLHEAAKLDERDIILLPIGERLTLLDFMLMDTKKYHQKALQIFTKLAEEQCIYCLRRLYQLHRRGSERLRVTRNLPRALEYLKQGAALDDATAIVELGRYYAEGTGGVPQSDAEAKKLYQQAAQLQHPGGYFYLSILMMQRIKTNVDVHQVMEYMEKVIQYDTPDNPILFSPGVIDKQESYAQRANTFRTGFKETFPMFFMSPNNDNDDDDNDSVDYSTAQTRHHTAATRSTVIPAAATTSATSATVPMRASSSSTLFHTPPPHTQAVLVDETPTSSAAAPPMTAIARATDDIPNAPQTALSGWCNVQ